MSKPIDLADVVGVSPETKDLAGKASFFYKYGAICITVSVVILIISAIVAFVGLGMLVFSDQKKVGGIMAGCGIGVGWLAIGAFYAIRKKPGTNDTDRSEDSS